MSVPGRTAGFIFFVRTKKTNQKKTAPAGVYMTVFSFPVDFGRRGILPLCQRATSLSHLIDQKPEIKIQPYTGKGIDHKRVRRKYERILVGSTGNSVIEPIRLIWLGLLG